MHATRISVKACLNGGPLLAVVDVVLDDCLVIKDIRIVEGGSKMIVAMPCRKATVRCECCNFKSTVGANYCCECGAQIPFQKLPEGRIYTDIAHPVTAEFRKVLVRDILAAYETERATRNCGVGTGKESSISSAVSSQFLRAIDETPLHS